MGCIIPLRRFYTLYWATPTIDVQYGLHYTFTAVLYSILGDTDIDVQYGLHTFTAVLYSTGRHRPSMFSMGCIPLRRFYTLYWRHRPSMFSMGCIIPLRRFYTLYGRHRPSMFSMGCIIPLRRFYTLYWATPTIDVQYGLHYTFTAVLYSILGDTDHRCSVWAALYLYGGSILYTGRHRPSMFSMGCIIPLRRFYTLYWATPTIDVQYGLHYTFTAVLYSILGDTDHRCSVWAALYLYGGSILYTGRHRPSMFSMGCIIPLRRFYTLYWATPTIDVQYGLHYTFTAVLYSILGDTDHRCSVWAALYLYGVWAALYLYGGSILYTERHRPSMFSMGCIIPLRRFYTLYWAIPTIDVQYGLHYTLTAVLYSILGDTTIDVQYGLHYTFTAVLYSILGDTDHRCSVWAALYLYGGSILYTGRHRPSMFSMGCIIPLRRFYTLYWAIPTIDVQYGLHYTFTAVLYSILGDTDHRCSVWAALYLDCGSILYTVRYRPSMFSMGCIIPLLRFYTLY
ncbi:hypothetical protein J6590_042156 [Homalodisca vitripennis]|nr:hypothetical protein J6590_042156 [Homalodisca vitripennis]